MGEMPLILPGCEKAGTEIPENLGGRVLKECYLVSEISRMVLFPGAKGNAVVGFVPSTRDGADDVSLEDEARLLGEASTAPSHSFGGGGPLRNGGGGLTL